MMTETGDYLPDLQNMSGSARKGRSGKVSLPAVTDEELKIQTAKTEVQDLIRTQEAE